MSKTAHTPAGSGNADAPILTTQRLALRRILATDAAFVLRLLNEPSFLEFIGDKGVRDLNDARRYIVDGPLHSYARHGFGMYLVELREDEEPIGFCGLVRRDALADVDIGFAFLPEHWSRGYAYESASALLEFAHVELGLRRIVAITQPDNLASIRLLHKLGLRAARPIVQNGEEILLLEPADASDTEID